MNNFYRNTNTYQQFCSGFSLLFPCLVVTIVTIMVAMFRGTYFVAITTNFISRRYRDENWSPCVFYTLALKLIFFNSISTFRHSIDKLIVPITTKLWPKTTSKILVPWKNVEQFQRTFVSLSTNSGIWTEISSTQNRGKPISIDELNDNFSTKLRLYSDGIRGKPPGVLMVL